MSHTATTSPQLPSLPPGPQSSRLVPAFIKVTVLDLHSKSDRDPVDAVLDDIDQYGAQRLVIGVKRRTPVGKALLGNVSQRLLLESPIPVLAVKIDEHRD